MEHFIDVRPVRLIDSGAADPLRLAVAAYLARYTGSSRDHAHSDLRCFLSWCAEPGLDPLAAGRVRILAQVDSHAGVHALYQDGTAAELARRAIEKLIATARANVATN